jgi:hypothetical protein
MSNIQLFTTNLSTNAEEQLNNTQNNLELLIHNYNVIISSFNLKKIIHIGLDLCSDLIFSKSELLHENEFNELLTLFNSVLNLFITNDKLLFHIKGLSLTQLDELINKFKTKSNFDTNEYNIYYNRIVLSIYLFLNYKKIMNLQVGQLIEYKNYKGDAYYKESYGEKLINYRNCNRFIIPNNMFKGMDEDQTKLLNDLIKKNILKNAFKNEAKLQELMEKLEHDGKLNELIIFMYRDAYK